MTRKEYQDYEERVRIFFTSTGIQNLTAGLLSCPDCLIPWNEEDQCPDCGMDRDAAEESYFSWSSCDCCGTSLGGNRVDATGYNPTTEEILEFTVCEDCIYYAEYGCLDDMTMDNLEEEDDSEA